MINVKSTYYGNGSKNKKKRSSAKKKRKALIVQRKSGTDRGGPVSREPERICSVRVLNDGGSSTKTLHALHSSQQRDLWI